MGRMSDLYIEKLENMTEEEQIKYEQEQAEADMAEACLLYTSDGCRRLLTCRSRWSPYH